MDPRLEAARRALAAQQGPVQTSPLVRAQQQLAQQARPKGNWIEEGFKQAFQQDPIFSTRQQQQQGGRGILGAIVGNPVTQTLLKPLEVLDYGRRGAVLGVEQLALALPEWAEWAMPVSKVVDEDRVRDDDRSNMDKLKDPTFGFGQIAASTGNDWLDRGIGFVGDVGLDPLTYLTFGTGSAVGAVGRGRAAAILAEKGFGEEIVQAAGRYGPAVLDNTAREALGLGRKGLYFGTKNNAVRVAGTETIADVLGKAVTGGRAMIGDTGAGRAIRNWRVPSPITENVERLTTGRGVGTAREAAGQIAAKDEKLLSQKTFQNVFSRRAHVLDDLGDNEAVAVTHALEDGIATGDTALARQVFDEVRDEARAQGVTGIGALPNYVMHSWTDKARRWLFGQDPNAVEVRRVFGIDETDSAGRAMERRIKPGTYTIGNTTFTLKEGTIREINDTLQPILGFKVLEDDIRKIMRRYVNTVGEDVGRAAMLNKFAAVVPESGAPAVDAPTQQVVDKAATAAKQAAEVANLAQVRDQSVARLKAMNTQIRGDLATAKGAVAQALEDDIEVLQSIRYAPQRVPTLIRDTKDALSKVRGLKPRVKREWEQTLDDLDRVAAVYDTNLDPQIVTLLQDTLMRMQDARWLEGWTLPAQRAWLRAAREGKITPVMKEILDEGWEIVGKNLLDTPDQIAVKRHIAEGFKRVEEEISSNRFWQLMDEYTSFFKGWATATPGFHFRNALSATFMNFTDGVGTREHLRAIQLWKQFKKDPEKFMAAADPKVAAAFRATFGSGAGGAFSTAELGDLGRFGWLSDNFWTRGSRAMGEWVEGPARLAMALDTTVRQGLDEQAALARISRIHFDYSQLSNVDRVAKRFIPFWTFMSRNLPLQIQQQWLRPKAYAHYNSLVRNLSQNEEGDVIPMKWREQGAFKVGTEVLGGDDLYLAPDLPQVRLQQELEKMLTPQRFLADANPLIRVPAETLVADRKMFTGNEFYEDENKWLYALLNLVPPTAQADRLSGGQLTAAFGEDPQYQQDRQAQSVLNYLGIPARQLTQQALEAELRRLAREAA